MLLTRGISLPSLSFSVGRKGPCLGAVPEASGWNEEPIEFMLSPNLEDSWQVVCFGGWQEGRLSGSVGVGY